MKFRKHHIQHHPFPAEKVFPLLSPEGEKRWLDGWDYRLIHSDTGRIELGCIFSTDHHADEETLWVVTAYDERAREVGFVRHSPNKNVVEIHIQVKDEGEAKSASEISYLTTPLTSAENERLVMDLDQEFVEMMDWWERSLHHYLKTGKMLRRK